MANCKDCLGFEFCLDGLGTTKYYDNAIAANNVEELCQKFKDRTRFVELPCKVGDTVYYITGFYRKYIKSAIVNEVVINCNGISELFVSNDTANFENSFDIFYLTREEAERALNNSENTNS